MSSFESKTSALRPTADDEGPGEPAGPVQGVTVGGRGVGGRGDREVGVEGVDAGSATTRLAPSFACEGPARCWPAPALPRAGSGQKLCQREKLLPQTKIEMLWKK